MLPSKAPRLMAISSRREAPRPSSGRARPVMAGLGIFLVATGLLLRFYAAPRLIAAPANIYLKDTLLAPRASYFDQGALTTRTGVTLTFTSTLRGDPGATTSKIAVWDSFTVLEDLKNRAQVISTYQRAAFDRRTGQLVHCCGAAVNDDTRVRQNGILLYFWPIGTHKATYQVFDTNTDRAWPAIYRGTARVEGITAYRFAQRIPPTQVQQLPGVPSSLVGLPGPARNVVADRYFQASNTYWVDPRTGVPLDVEERIHSVLRGPGSQDGLVVADADLKMSEPSRRSLAALARQNAVSIGTLRVTGPLGGGILGLLLILAGTVPFGRGRRKGPNSGAADAPAALPPT